jgi:hypothetical protein
VIHVSIALVVFGVGYFIMVNRLYAGYRNKIRVKLENSEFQQDKLEQGLTQVTQKLERFLLVPDSNKAVFSYKLLEKINAGQSRVWINSLIKNEDDSIKLYAQDKINEMKGLSVSDQYVIRLDNSKVDSSDKNVLNKADLQLLIDNAGDITKSRIQKLTRSSNRNDRQYAAELLLHTTSDECLPFLIELLGDTESKVRNAAIKSAVKKNNLEVVNVLIESMDNPVYSNQAMNAIILIFDWFKNPTCIGGSLLSQRAEHAPDATDHPGDGLDRRATRKRFTME